MARRNRQGLARRRTGAALGAGTAVLAVTLVLGTAWPVALAASWGVVALVIVGSVWIRIPAAAAAEGKGHSPAADVSRPARGLLGPARRPGVAGGQRRQPRRDRLPGAPGRQCPRRDEDRADRAGD